MIEQRYEIRVSIDKKGKINFISRGSLASNMLEGIVKKSAIRLLQLSPASSKPYCTMKVRIY